MTDLWRISKSENPVKKTISLKPEYNLRGYDGVSKGKLSYFWDGSSWQDISNSDEKLLKAIDDSLNEKAMRYIEKGETVSVISPQWNISENKNFQHFVKNYSMNYDKEFNTRVIFDNEVVTRNMYASTILSYHPEEKPTPYFDKVMDVWFPNSTEMILWFVGAALLGETNHIQKMVFIYGEPKSGKSSLLEIIDWLFEDYIHEMSINSFTSTSDQFASGLFKNAPVIVDRDADIKRIQNKILFNKFISHESFSVNKKHVSPYDSRFTGILFAASNYVFDMGDPGKDGTARRVASVYSKGARIPFEEYTQAMKAIKEDELPGIAQKAIDTFHRLGPAWSNELEIDPDMMYKSNLAYQFIRDSYMDGRIGNIIKWKDVGDMYRDFLEDDDLTTTNAKHRIKEAMSQYYKFADRIKLDGKDYKSVFYDPDVAKILGIPKQKEEPAQQEAPSKEPEFNSDFNYFEHSTFPGQETNDKGNPKWPWDKVITTASQIDQSQLHYIRAPKSLIRLDFDADTLEENIKLSKNYPVTYGEISKSGKGIHLWYFYDGDDVETLVHHISPDIEIKVNTGKSGVRRKFTKSNGVEELAHMEPSDLSHKETNMLKDIQNMFINEKTLRAQIEKSLRKENTGSTITEVQFIQHLLDEAMASGKDFDVKDLRPKVLSFALRSSHQSAKALEIFSKLNFSSKPEEIQREDNDKAQGFVDIPDEQLVMFDIESIPDLFMVSYMKHGTNEPKTLIWYEPLGMKITREEIDELLSQPLVGFNNLRYDNHIMYGAHLGKKPEELFYQSKHLVTNGDNSGSYNAAYQLAYTDLYDLIPDKQSLKKWEIEMGMKHNELNVDWELTAQENADQLGVTVQEFIETMAEYNRDDVMASDALLDYRYADYEARKMLAELTNKPVSTTTNNLSAAFIFGDDKRPQDKLVYTDLREQFPGYTYQYDPKTKKMINEYRGFDPSNGGFVYTNPGIHENVVELDVRSMHPNSAIALGYFGPYASRFEELVEVVALLKHPTDENLAQVKQMLGGALVPYIKPTTNYGALRYSLKIVINATYGMSSAKFDNKFRAPKNVDNIIAKRGALYMIDLKYHIESLGYTVVHIKTDSIKVSNANEDIINDIQEFARSYGYEMEIAGMYDRMVLIDKAQLIAHYKDGGEKDWHAIGKEFAEPYVYKRLFTHDDLEESDYYITKTTKAGPMYLGDEFIGKAGSFYPSKSGHELMWEKDGKRNSVSGTKGYLWRVDQEFTKDDLDMSYYDERIEQSINKIKKVGDINKLLPGFEVA